jgi:hypothetical protein
MPVYFQATKDASPIRSSILILAAVFSIIPGGMIGGITVKHFNRYLPQNYVGWALVVSGFATLSSLTPSSPIGAAVGFQIIVGLGIGMLYNATTFPVLAPVDVSLSAQALALYTFIRGFAQVPSYFILIIVL